MTTKDQHGGHAIGRRISPAIEGQRPSLKISIDQSVKNAAMEAAKADGISLSMFIEKLLERELEAREDRKVVGGPMRMTANRHR